MSLCLFLTINITGTRFSHIFNRWCFIIPMKVDMYDIIIVSVFYNRENMVEESIKSVLSQIKGSNTLFIAVDDGSIDSTKEKLNNFSGHENYLFLSQENKGFVHTMIEVINSYDSKYIAIHGSGDFSYSGRFKMQKEYLDNNDDVACIGCKIKKSYPDGSYQIAGESFNLDYRELIITNNPYSHGEVMIRRSAYKKVGGYDPFFKYAQDRDLWCRLSLVGKFASLDSVLYERHVAVPGSVSGDLNKTLLQRYLSNYATFKHGQLLKNSPLAFSGEHDAFLFDKRIVMADIKMIFYRKLIRKNYHDAQFFLKHYCSESGDVIGGGIMKLAYITFKLLKIKLR